MEIKFIIFFVILFFSIIYENMKVKNKKVSKIILIIIVFLLSAMYAARKFLFENYGTDYYSYKEWYEFMSLGIKNIFSSNNIGFNFLIVITKLLFNNFYCFLFLVGIIINSCVLKYITSNSKQITLSMMIYLTIFYFSTFNIMRQWIACAIYLLLYESLKNKKIIKYIIGCVIASMFHTSAVMLIFLYPFVNIGKASIKKFILTIIIGIIIAININYIEINFLYSNGISIFEEYSKYQNYNLGISNYMNFSICLTNFIIMIWLILKHKYILERRDENVKSNLLVIAIIFSFISTKSFAFARFSMYFMPIILLTIPDMLEVVRKKDRSIILPIIYLILLFVFIS